MKLAARSLSLFALALLALTSPSYSQSLASVFPPVPPSNHVFIVVEENHGYGDINALTMPYLTALASQYAVATNYYADVHPSIGNYFMLTTGEPQTLNDSFTGLITSDNIVRRLMLAGKTYKEYSESLPYAGYTGPDVFPYVEHHNPLSYFGEVRNSSTAASVLVPFSQLAVDIANQQLPDFGFIVPNALNDAHSATLQAADAWLRANIAPLLASPQFQQDGVLIIVFDEAELTDFSFGGGHVFMAVIGPKVKRGYRSTTFYQHQNTLNLMLSALGVTSYPGLSEFAFGMGEFFGASAPAAIAPQAVPPSPIIPHGQPMPNP